MALRMMQALDLSESQRTRVRELLVASELRSQQERDATAAKVRELLTPQQQETYDGWMTQLRGWGRGAPRRSGAIPGGGANNPMGMFGDMQQRLQELNLTAEQQEKIQAIMERSRTTWTDALAKMQQGERVDWMQLIREQTGGTRSEIEKLLTPQQREKFTEMNRGIDELLGAFGLRREDRPAPTQPTQPADPNSELLGRALAILGCESAEEEAVFRPLLEKLITYRTSSAPRIEERRQALASLASQAGSSEQALEQALSELAAVERAYYDRLALLENGVRELLTKRQELGLIGLGVLRVERAQ
jgi:Spy/CpxP family protein refolding chaperone